MPKRKYTENSTVRRKQLLSRVSEENKTMRPCDCCISHAKECRISEESSRCSKCLSSNVSYSLYVSDADWDWIDREQVELEKSLETLYAKQLSVFAKQAKLSAKLLSVKRRKREMFARELANIHELEVEEWWSKEDHIIAFDSELASVLPGEVLHSSVETPEALPKPFSDLP